MKHITLEDWKVGGAFYQLADPGDTVDDDVIEEMRNVLPSLIDRATYLQCGEPCGYSYDVERDDLRHTFMTFWKEWLDEPWVYLGTCFPRGTEHKE